MHIGGYMFFGALLLLPCVQEAVCGNPRRGYREAEALDQYYRQMFINKRLAEIRRHEEYQRDLRSRYSDQRIVTIPAWSVYVDHSPAIKAEVDGLKEDFEKLKLLLIEYFEKKDVQLSLPFSTPE